MGVGLSLEITIPESVMPEVIIALGGICAPDDAGGMDVGEALQWVFSDPGGITALAALGVTWHTIQTGRVTE